MDGSNGADRWITHAEIAECARIHGMSRRKTEDFTDFVLAMDAVHMKHAAKRRGASGSSNTAPRG